MCEKPAAAQPVRAENWYEDRIPLEMLWRAALLLFCFNIRLQMILPWPVPLVHPCWSSAARHVLLLAVRGLRSQHNATWGRNVAPKCDRSNLEEVELQG